VCVYVEVCQRAHIGDDQLADSTVLTEKEAGLLMKILKLQRPVVQPSYDP